MKKLKTIRSHTGVARFLEECSEEPVAWLSRSQVKQIKSPYRYSPVVPVYEHGEKLVCWFETAHRVYEVYEVPTELPRFYNEEEAAGASCQGNLRSP